MTAMDQRAHLLAERAALEATIATLLAGFTEQTGLVVTKVRVDAAGAVACRVELGRDDETAVVAEAPCCEHEPTRHAKDGCWGNVVTADGAFERCGCRGRPGTATDM